MTEKKNTRYNRIRSESQSVRFVVRKNRR